MTSQMHTFIARILLAVILVLGGMNAADARAGGGSSSGSRGSKTFSAPPPTQTAPSAAAPIQRTITPPPAAAPAPSMAAPSAPPPQMAPPMARPSFARSLMTGLAAGFLGAGLFGMLTGGGFFGGLGSFAGILGLLVQVAVLGLIAMMALRYFRGRQSPMMNSGPVNFRPAPGMARAAAPQPAAAPAVTPITIGEADYNAFENALKSIQSSYGNEDIATLRRFATPEMASYFEQALSENAAKGQVNRVSEPALLQGNLAEAWRERDDEYATVAMRYSLADAMVERATGHIVSGSLDQPQEVTEIWTFRRKTGGNWVLSAIQQTQ